MNPLEQEEQKNEQDIKNFENRIFWFWTVVAISSIAEILWAYRKLIWEYIQKHF